MMAKTPSAGHEPQVDFNIATPGYFSTVRIDKGEAGRLEELPKSVMEVVHRVCCR